MWSSCFLNCFRNGGQQPNSWNSQEDVGVPSPYKKAGTKPGKGKGNGCSSTLKKLEHQSSSTVSSVPRSSAEQSSKRASYEQDTCRTSTCTDTTGRSSSVSCRVQDRFDDPSQQRLVSRTVMMESQSDTDHGSLWASNQFLPAKLTSEASSRSQSSALAIPVCTSAGSTCPDGHAHGALYSLHAADALDSEQVMTSHNSGASLHTLVNNPLALELVQYIGSGGRWV